MANYKEKAAEKPSKAAGDLHHDGEVVCQFCWRGSEVEDIAGVLHAETSEFSSKIAAAHHKCMQYASGLVQYKINIFGGFEIDEVEKEIARGSKLRCFICRGKEKGKRSTGAVCGCAVKSCRKTFHFVCAYLNDVAITKRLVVTRNKQNKKYVLYRVFCSPAHEAAFRENLKQELRTKKKWGDDSSEEDDDSQNDSTSKTPLNSSNSCNFSVISIGSPVTNSSASDGILEFASPAQRDLAVSDDIGVGNIENSLIENGHEERAESDPTVSSTPPQNKDRRKSGTFRNSRSRQSKIHTAQPPQCSPIAEELSEQSQSSDSSLYKPVDSNKQVQSALQNEACVVLENLNSIQVVADVHINNKQDTALIFTVPSVSPGKVGSVVSPATRVSRSPRRSPMASPGKSADSTYASVSSENGSPVGRGLRKSMQQPSPLKDDQQTNTSRRLLPASQQNGSQSKTPTKTADLRARSTERSPKRGLLSPCKTIVNITSPQKDDQAQSQEKNAVQHSPYQNRPSKISMQLTIDAGQTIFTADHQDMEVEGNSVAQDMCVSPNNASLSDSIEFHTPTGQGTSMEVSMSPESTKRHGRSRSLRSPQSERRSPAGADKDPAVLLDILPSTPQKEPADTGDGHGRKRKLHQRNSSGDGCSSEVFDKVARTSSNEDSQLVCAVLLLPADFDGMDWDIVRHEVAVSMGVQADQVWIWCPHTTDVPLCDAFIFFVVDIIKAIENKDSSSLQALLFDGQYLAGRNDNYRQQVQMMKDLGDAEVEKEMLATVWSCVERKVKSMAPSPANKWQAAHLFRFTEQVALVLDLRVCDQTHHIRARISALKGLYRWTESTVVDTFPRLNMESRQLSAEMETLTLTVWLREVCQVQQVLIYPQDPHFCDTTVPDTTNRLTSLVDMLKEKFTTDVNKTSETAGKRTNSDDKSPVLLVFFPVDFEVANFSQYFQKVMKTFVRRSSAANLLALVPTTNLHFDTYGSVSALIGGIGGVWNDLTVEILSAFNPADEPVSLLVLKISPAQLASADKSQDDTGCQTAAAGKKKGRPPAAAGKKKGRPPKTMQTDSPTQKKRGRPLRKK